MNPKSLHPFLIRLACTAILWLATGSGCLGQNVELTIRASWGGSSPRVYFAKLHVSSGRLTVVRPLGMLTESTLDALQTSTDTIALANPEPVTYGGADFQVDAPATATLSLEVYDLQPSGRPTVHSWTVGELIQSSVSAKLDERGNRFHLARSPGNRIEVDFQRPSPIYRSLEPIAVLCRPHLTSLPSGSARLTVELQRDSDQEIVHRTTHSIMIDDSGSAVALPLNDLVAPETEGSYTLRIHLESRRRIANLVAGPASIHRNVQLVVLQPNRKSMEHEPWQTTQWIDPLEPDHRPLLPQLLRFGQANVSKRQTRATTEEPLWELADGRKALRLSPQSAQVFDLQAEHLGMPHLVVVRTPSNMEMQLALSILDVEATGKIESLTLDSAIEIAPNPFQSSQRDDVAMETEHRLVFWPKQRHPKLVIFNPSSAKEAALLGIEIQSGPTLLVNTLTNAKATPSKVPFAPNASDSRLAAIHIDKPLLVEAFGGPAAAGSASGTPIDDWNTFLQAGQRLADYCEWAGYNAVILNIASEGGTLFPSRVLRSTPRFDSGVHSAVTSDPSQKDVVSLLLEIFERQGLKLILELDFNSPIASLEEQRLRQAILSGKSLFDALVNRPTLPIDQSRIELEANPGSSHSTRPSPSLYSPLSSELQGAVTQVVQEIRERYERRPALDGIALRLSGESHLLFAGDLYHGAADDWIEFANAYQVNLPADPIERAHFFIESASPLWLTWRASKVGEYFRHLALELATNERKTKLYLLMAGLFDEPPASDKFSNPGRFLSDPLEMLLARGLDLVHFQPADNLILVAGESPQPFDPLPDQQWAHTAIDDSRIEFLINQWSNTGGQITQQPRGIRLKDLPTDSLFAFGRVGWFFPQSTEVDQAARRKLARRFMKDDCQLLAQGGWIPQFGQEDACRGFLRTYAALPPAKMSPVMVRSSQDFTSPIIVRQGTFESANYLSIINSAPWPEVVDLHWADAANSSIQWLSAEPQHTVNESREGGMPNQIVIPPYDLIGLKVVEGRVVLADWDHQPAVEIADPIRRELDKLTLRVNRAETRKASIPLSNSDFEAESIPEDPVPGWIISKSPSVNVSIDKQWYQSGQCSVQLTGRNPSGNAWIQTPAVAVPHSGRLAIELSLRAPEVKPSMRMSVVVSGRRADGSKFRHAAPVALQLVQSATTNLGPSLSRTPPTWQRQLVPLLHDVMPEGVQEVQIAIELEGDGTVWLDDIRLLDFYLLEGEKQALRSNLFLASTEFDRGNFMFTYDFLESYWAHYLRNFVDLNRLPDATGPAGVVGEATAATGANASDHRSWFQRFRDARSKNRTKR